MVSLLVALVVAVVFVVVFHLLFDLWVVRFLENNRTYFERVDPEVNP